VSRCEAGVAVGMWDVVRLDEVQGLQESSNLVGTACMLEQWTHVYVSVASRVSENGPSCAVV
jgi:hypothetical protein